jgi:hypothetical protein
MAKYKRQRRPIIIAALQEVIKKDAPGQWEIDFGDVDGCMVQANSKFGYSVSITDDFAAVSAPREKSNSGSSLWYTRIMMKVGYFFQKLVSESTAIMNSSGNLYLQ